MRQLICTAATLRRIIHFDFFKQYCMSRDTTPAYHQYLPAPHRPGSYFHWRGRYFRNAAIPFAFSFPDSFTAPSAPLGTPSLPPLPPPTPLSGCPVYQFIDPSPTILNCFVLAPFSVLAFIVETSNVVLGPTTIKSDRGQPVACIEWDDDDNAVEIYGKLPRILVRDWLILVSDPIYRRQVFNLVICNFFTRLCRRVRYMDYNSHRYVWVPYEDKIYVCFKVYPSEILVIYFRLSASSIVIHTIPKHPLVQLLPDMVVQHPYK